MRRSNEEWRDMVEAWDRSSLTANEFAEARGINPRTLTFWKWRLSKQKDQRPPARRAAPIKPSFTEVTLPIAPTIEIAMTGVTVRVPSGVSDDHLRDVLRVLRSLS